MTLVVFILSVSDNMIKLMQRVRGLAKPIVVAMMVAIIGAGTAFAQTSNSNNYQVTETEFGATSAQESCSGQYCAKVSLGDMATGRSTGSGGSAMFGPVTSGEPLLEVIVDPGISNLGDLSTTQTATKTTIVKIRSYLSDGYMLQIMGDPPKYGSHTLHALSTPTASQPGTEQFGLNLVANTTPSVGAGPVQVPDSQTSFGEVNDDYKIANQFKYVPGDVVAHSTVATGQTDYTVSLIVNISESTPAGHYTGDYSAVVIPMY